MGKVEVKLERTGYDSVKLSRTVNREFTAFATPAPIESSDTISELFRLYDKFYFEIPATGQSLSHEYLVTKSSQIYTPPAAPVEVQPLLDEIAQLREELLQANQEIVKLTSQST